LVLRPKPRNHRGDFEAQITKPELPVLSPKPGNPPPPWFWGSTKKPTIAFEAKPGETVTTSFEAKLEKTVATGFEAKPAKTVAAGFEAKPLEIVQMVLRPNHSQTTDLGFKAQPRNPRS
jgi:alkanesulfonate monooxygenase SsuD/methylene tetrahydromethanopterin reductase-like flavin-dependent oxidoreductase (luciferase family)